MELFIEVRKEFGTKITLMHDHVHNVFFQLAPEEPFIQAKLVFSTTEPIYIATFNVSSQVKVSCSALYQTIVNSCCITLAHTLPFTRTISNAFSMQIDTQCSGTQPENITATLNNSDSLVVSYNCQIGKHSARCGNVLSIHVNTALSVTVNLSKHLTFSNHYTAVIGLVNTGGDSESNELTISMFQMNLGLNLNYYWSFFTQIHLMCRKCLQVCFRVRIVSPAHLLKGPQL